MKSDNIVKKLEKEGYNIAYKKWGYWNNIPHVELDGFDFTIAEYIYLENGWLGCNLDFIYNHVLDAINLAQVNNLILLKKIEKSPSEDYYYMQYMIRSMEDYYMYKKKKYPYNEYWNIINKLEKEIK